MIKNHRGIDFNKRRGAWPSVPELHLLSGDEKKNTFSLSRDDGGRRDMRLTENVTFQHFCCVFSPNTGLQAL